MSGANNIHRVVGRWYWTADRSRLVPEGNGEAAYLAFPNGEEITVDQARAVGLVDAEAKSALPEENKMTSPRKVRETK